MEVQGDRADGWAGRGCDAPLAQLPHSHAASHARSHAASHRNSSP